MITDQLPIAPPPMPNSSNANMGNTNIGNGGSTTGNSAATQADGSQPADGSTSTQSDFGSVMDAATQRSTSPNTTQTSSNSTAGTTTQASAKPTKSSSTHVDATNNVQVPTPVTSASLPTALPPIPGQEAQIAQADAAKSAADTTTKTTDPTVDQTNGAAQPANASQAAASQPKTPTANGGRPSGQNLSQAMIGHYALSGGTAADAQTTDAKAAADATANATANAAESQTVAQDPAATQTTPNETMARQTDPKNQTPVKGIPAPALKTTSATPALSLSASPTSNANGTVSSAAITGKKSGDGKSTGDADTADQSSAQNTNGPNDAAIATAQAATMQNSVIGNASQAAALQKAVNGDNSAIDATSEGGTSASRTAQTSSAMKAQEFTDALSNVPSGAAQTNPASGFDAAITAQQAISAPNGTNATASTAAASASSAAHATKPAPPAEQVAVKLAQAATNGARSVIVELRPEALGRVEVKLDFRQGGTVNVQMTMDKAETYENFRNNKSGLEQQLNQAGLNLGGGGLDLRFGQGGQQSTGSQSAATARTIMPVAQSDETIESATDTTKQVNNLIDISA